MLEVVKPLVDRLQELLEKKMNVFYGQSTCSHEFIKILEDIESEATRHLEQYGWRKLDESLWRTRRETEDLVLALYVVDNLLVEFGIKGYNRCAPLDELVQRIGPPKLYMRMYAPGMKLIATIEANHKKEEHAGEERPSYIF